jgi:PAS domain S-box-containing protein
MGPFDLEFWPGIKDTADRRIVSAMRASGFLHLSFKRFISAAIALALILVGLAVGYGYVRWEVDRRANYWVEHAHRVIETTLSLFPEAQAAILRDQDLVDLNSPERQGAYRQAIVGVRKTEADLKALLADNPAQTARERRMARDLNDWLAGMDQMAALSTSGHADMARALITKGALRPRFARVQQDGDELIAVERGLLVRRMQVADQANWLSYDIALALAILALTGLVTMIIALGRANTRLSRAADETRRSREEHLTSQALMEAVFSNIPDYLMVLNVEADGRFSVADINPALAKVFGVERTAVRGATLEKLFPGKIAEVIGAHYRGIVARGQPAMIRRNVKLLPGAPRIWESIVAPVTNSEGRVDRLVGAIRDVTDQAKAEARLRESQRMEAIGQLTGGVAHDFNNLLQVIWGNLELLQPYVETEPTAKRRLEHAIMGADRAARLTTQLLAFARRQPLAPEIIDLTHLSRNMSELLRRTLGESVKVETVISETLWPVLADPAQVESAILNLALNARAAMPGGGRLILRVENARLSDEEAGEFDLAGGDFVLIAVSDTGEGMAPEVLSRAFEPFFTTKGDGKGTGLGLSMVYGFVRQSKGAVRIESSPGEGATVRIWLPRSEEAPAPDLAVPPAPAPGHHQTILVVEDEPQVRAAAIATLTDLGYRCREASDPEAALAALDEGVALIFSDVVMPGSLKTQAFAAAIHAKAPGVPILFTSGYAQQAMTADGALESGVNLISKPYSREALARKIAEALAGAPAG